MAAGTGNPDEHAGGTSRPLDLGWLRSSRAEWGVRAVPSRIGLTLKDIAIASYGDVPDHPPRRTMAPRGSDVPDQVPDMGYTINDKAEVWSDNVMELYEEAVSRQWSATRDIPWGDLAPIDPDLEHAMCQLATVLSEVEMVAADFPAKWLWRINHDFVEAKMFLCTQAMDEARHTEVFRKRALANGGGLGRATAIVEQFLKVILDAQSYDEGSALMHLLGEGLVLSLFRAGEMIAPSEVEKRIFRLCMQDEARHVSYGTMHLRYRLQRDPSLANDFHTYLDRGEELIGVLLSTPEVTEPATILAAGSLAAASELGTAATDVLRVQSIEEYLQRCDRAGLDRRGRMRLPDEMIAGTSGAVPQVSTRPADSVGARS
ncbi:MAG: ferritin family protein [Acidimicrobiales bacterium]